MSTKTMLTVADFLLGNIPATVKGNRGKVSASVTLKTADGGSIRAKLKKAPTGLSDDDFLKASESGLTVSKTGKISDALSKLFKREHMSGEYARGALASLMAGLVSPPTEPTEPTEPTK